LCVCVWLCVCVCACVCVCVWLCVCKEVQGLFNNRNYIALIKKDTIL